MLEFPNKDVLQSLKIILSMKTVQTSTVRMSSLFAKVLVYGVSSIYTGTAG